MQQKRSRRHYSDKDTRRADYTEVYLCFDGNNLMGGLRKKLGNIPTDQTNSYLEQLESFVPQSGACMRYHFYFVLHSHPFKAKGKMWQKKTIYIVPANAQPENIKFLCGAKNCRQCLGNIPYKCMDPFVQTNIIGFFGKTK